MKRVLKCQDTREAGHEINEKFHGDSMKNILVTGASGFIGLNLVAALRQRDNIVINTIEIEDDRATLESNLHKADIIYHLAGINRPKTEGL